MTKLEWSLPSELEYLYYAGRFGKLPDTGHFPLISIEMDADKYMWVVGKLPGGTCR